MLSSRVNNSKVIITSKLNYFWLIYQKLNFVRRKLFRSSCFGCWLDTNFFEHEPLLIDYMIHKQHEVDAFHNDMPLIYYFDGHRLHFGRSEFALITGMLFGPIEMCSYTSSELKFRNRVFPHKVGLPVTSLDVLGVIEDELMFGNMSDEDSVRLCLILSLEVIFMGRLLTCPVHDSLFGLVENLDAWNVFPWGEHIWTHLYNSIKNLVAKHSDTHYLRSKKDPNYVATYTVGGFVFAFQIWILETFERSNRWWTKFPQVIPRGIGWSKKSIFKRSDCCYLFAKDSRARTDIRPTGAEYECSWWLESNLFIEKHVPKPPVTEHHPLFEAYLSKLEKSRKRLSTSSKEASSVRILPSRLKTRPLTDRVIREQNVIIFKLETIIHVLALERNDKLRRLQFSDDFSSLRCDFVESLNTLYQDLVAPQASLEYNTNDPFVDEQLKLCLEEEARICIENQKIIEQQRAIILEEEKRLTLELQKKFREDEVKKRKRIEFLKSSHAKNILAKLPPFKTNVPQSNTCSAKPNISFVRINKFRQIVNDPCLDEMLAKVKPWEEDVSRVLRLMDTVWLTEDIQRFIGRPGQLKCKFPWNDDYTVNRNFWLRLACLDPARRGWLTEEHIDLWVDYMWHVRRGTSNWAMVSCYFAQILMQKSIPLFYANGDRYAIPWSDVDQVYIPMNETEEHWCLAHLDIQSGLVTFYDSGNTHDYEYRDWYVRARDCLKERLPLVLDGAKVFNKKGLDSSQYKITFKLAEKTPKQSGIFGDCGVWVCIFLYRLAHGKSLEVEDPIDVALAYREKMIRFFFKHKILNC